MLDVILTKDVEPALALAQQLGWDGVISLQAKHDGVIVGSQKPGSAFVAMQFSEKCKSLMEKGLVDCVYGFEFLATKDSLHQRNAGLDEPTARIMRQKYIAYAIPFGMLLASKQRAPLLGRIMQNIVISRKNKVAICLASFAESPQGMRSSSDLASFGISLGLRPEEAKKALDFAEERVAINKKKQQKAYISPDLFVE
jgi:hypothetical protein